MKTRMINIKSVKHHAELSPRTDPMFSKLFKLALNGKVPTYFANIPFRLVHPFDKQYCPQDHPDGRGIVHQMESGIAVDNAPTIWVYPKDGIFILSDDYLAYTALRNARMELLPCYVMGEPAGCEVKDIRGPLGVKGVMEAMGIELE